MIGPVTEEPYVSVRKMSKNWPSDIRNPMSVRLESYSHAKLFPRPRAKSYIHSVVGQRPKLIWYMVYWYIVYGSDRGYTVDRMKGIRYLVVYFPPTRSTPGGSADSI